jgi:hypothetical protein
VPNPSIPTEAIYVTGELLFSEEDRSIRLELYPLDSVIGIAKFRNMIGDKPLAIESASIDPVCGRGKIMITMKARE